MSSAPSSKESETAESNDSQLVSKTAGIVAHGDIIAHTIHVKIAHSSAQSSQAPSPTTSFRIIETPIHIFIGREELLQKIHDKLQERSEEDHFMKRIVAIVAMGGMGKTETARKLAQQYRKAYENVAWINSESESSVRESFTKIAKVLSLPSSDDSNGKEVAEHVYEHISRHVQQPTLFIFDNVNQLKSDGKVFGIYDYLPKQVTEKVPLILLTSQTTEWRRHQCEVIHVVELNVEESLSLLKSRFQLSSEEVEDDSDLQDLLQKLTEKLNGYPLALGLAAANIPYIPGQDSLEFLKQSLKEYIQNVDDNRILEQRVDTDLATNYPRTLLKVWDIAMTNLDRRKAGREAKILLGMIAHFPQEYLRYHRMKTGYNAGKSELIGIKFLTENDASFDDALRELLTLGLARDEISIEAHRRAEKLLGRAFLTTKLPRPFYDYFIKVHRLVQALARHYEYGAAGIQMIIIHNVEDPKNEWSHIELLEEYLWSMKGLPSWALENENTALLWLQGLRFVRNEGRQEGTRKDSCWKNQLGKFTNGKNIVLVAEFIVNNNR